MNSDDKPIEETDVVKEIEQKYDALNEAVRDTVQGITDRMKPLTDEIDVMKPDPPP